MRRGCVMLIMLAGWRRDEQTGPAGKLQTHAFWMDFRWNAGFNFLPLDFRVLFLMDGHLLVGWYCINGMKMMCLVQIILSYCESATLFIHTPTEAHKFDKGLTKVIKLSSPNLPAYVARMRQKTDNPRSRPGSRPRTDEEHLSLLVNSMRAMHMC